MNERAITIAILLLIAHFNNKYERVGPLWQGKYRSVPIQSENVLETIIKYVEYNPVRAKLAEKISDYPFVSNLTEEKFDGDWNPKNDRVWDTVSRMHTYAF